MEERDVQRAALQIGVQQGTKLVHLQYVPEEQAWLLWTHADVRLREGTLIKLYHDGHADRITVSRDGTEDVVRIR